MTSLPAVSDQEVEAAAAEWTECYLHVRWDQIGEPLKHAFRKAALKALAAARRTQLPPK
jgi:hypothetical protein